MQHLKVSGAVRPLKWSFGVKWLKNYRPIGKKKPGQTIKEIFRLMGLERVNKWPNSVMITT